MMNPRPVTHGSVGVKREVATEWTSNGIPPKWHTSLPKTEAYRELQIIADMMA
jgi:hypothetical protein